MHTEGADGLYGEIGEEEGGVGPTVQPPQTNDEVSHIPSHIHMDAG